MKKEFDYSKVIKPRAGSPYYYIHIKDGNGKLKRISTHEKDYKKACIYYDLHYGKESKRRVPTFGEYYHLYTSATTNPAYLQAKAEGGRYGLLRAKHIASDFKNMESTFIERLPDIMKKPINLMERLDFKIIKDIIVEEKGRRRSAQSLFQDIKAMMSQAKEDCLIDINYAAGLKNIYYEKQTPEAYDLEFIIKLLSPATKEALAKKGLSEEWAYFAVIATTGMRKSEVLALDTSQLKPGKIIVVNRALKSSKRDDVALPKCDVTRAIVVGNLTVAALKSTNVLSGRIFYHGWDWSLKAIRKTELALKEIYGYCPHLQCHRFRHTLHSLLLGEDDLNITYIQQYFGWGHQLLLDVQRGYTHYYTHNYEKIADRIDALLSGRKSPCQKDRDENEFLLENWN